MEGRWREGGGKVRLAQTGNKLQGEELELEMGRSVISGMLDWMLDEHKLGCFLPHLSSQVR